MLMLELVENDTLDASSGNPKNEKVEKPAKEEKESAPKKPETPAPEPEAAPSQETPAEENAPEPEQSESKINLQEDKKLIKLLEACNWMKFTFIGRYYQPGNIEAVTMETIKNTLICFQRFIPFSKEQKEFRDYLREKYGDCIK